MSLSLTPATDLRPIGSAPKSRVTVSEPSLAVSSPAPRPQPDAAAASAARTEAAARARLIRRGPPAGTRRPCPARDAPSASRPAAGTATWATPAASVVAVAEPSVTVAPGTATPRPWSS